MAGKDYRPSGPGETEELTDMSGTGVQTRVMPQIWTMPQTKNWDQIGKPEQRVDAIKLAQGKPAFTDDMEMRGMLYAKILTSPVAHARIKKIDTAKAKALPGVVAVLTWEDLPRVIYSTAGTIRTNPGRWMPFRWITRCVS